MKTRILFFIFMIGMVIVTFSQKSTMTLTCTADNNGQHVPLDSILIENLTQGGDTTLYAPDTVLVLDYIVGIEEVSDFSGDGFSLSQNYPNPMKGITTIGFRMSESEHILVTVNDILGKELIHQEYLLERGSHSFTFLPGRESLYFLTALANKQSQTIKMFNSLSNLRGSGASELKYIGQQAGFDEYKSGTPLVNFAFSLGDLLKLTSFTNQGERAMTIAPTGSQTCCFHYTGNPCSGTPTITDIDGNIYNTVQIGDQCWMKENLKTTTYSNGTPIPNITDSQEWTNLTTGAYVWQNNDISWKNLYGALYNWYTTVDPNGLCPAGWHVPTDDEWTVLTDFIGGTGSPHGNELKSCRRVNSPLGGGCNTTEHPRWTEYYDYYGTDDYGFSGLPGAHRSLDGVFSISSIGNSCIWWSSSQYGPFDLAGRRSLYYNYPNISYEGHFNKHFGYSIRCLRD